MSLKDGAVKLKAAYLYADLAESTDLQKNFTNEFSAKVIRSYLAGACRVIRANGGSIKSFDGDRVMGVFVGRSMRNDAVNAALKINWLVVKCLNPLIKDRLIALKSNRTLELKHGVGVDAGEAFVVRAGVRNSSGETTHNDLISIGRVPNVAAKLSSIRDEYKRFIWITEDVYTYLNEDQLRSKPNRNPMWTGPHRRQVGPYALNLYASTWNRSP